MPATRGFAFSSTLSRATWSAHGPNGKSGQRRNRTATRRLPDPGIDETSDSGQRCRWCSDRRERDDEPIRSGTSRARSSRSANMDLGLEFWRWLDSDVALDMVNTVEVYDGANWITLWASGGITNHQWTEQGFDLMAYRSANELPIGDSVGSAGAHVVSSWNIDDVSGDPSATARRLRRLRHHRLRLRLRLRRPRRRLTAWTNDDPDDAAHRYPSTRSVWVSGNDHGREPRPERFAARGRTTSTCCSSARRQGCARHVGCRGVILTITSSTYTRRSGCDRAAGPLRPLEALPAGRLPAQRYVPGPGAHADRSRLAGRSTARTRTARGASTSSTTWVTPARSTAGSSR